MPDATPVSEMLVGRVQDHPYFEPFVGDRYASKLAAMSSGRLVDGICDRIHVMGESHYSDPDDPDAYIATPQLAKQIVRDWGVKASSGRAFFTKMLRAVSGDPAADLDHEAIWSNIAYSNFIQSLLERPRAPVSAQLWQAGRNAFFAQLALTRPTVLVVLGKRLWGQLPSQVGGWAHDLPAMPLSDVVNDAWIYPYLVDGHLYVTLAVSLFHPSSFGKFNAEVAARRVNAGRYFHSNIACAVVETLARSL